LGSDRTFLNKIAVDATGDIYACGVLTNGGEPPARIRILKLFGRTGQVLWVSGLSYSANHRAYNECRSLLIDRQGSVIVGANVVVGGYQIVQLVVTKLTAQGETVWSRWLGDFNDNITSSLADTAIDSGGDVFAAGYVNLVDYGNTLLKFSGIDGMESWRRPPFEGFYGTPSSISVDAAGDVVVAGNRVLQKLSGRDGQLVWGYEQPYPIFARSTSVAIDPSGDVFLGDGTSVAKLSGSTGNRIWVSAVPAGKVVLDTHGVPSVLLSDGSGIARLDPLSGREVWGRNQEDDYVVRDLATDRFSNIATAGTSRGAAAGVFSIAKVSGGDGGLLWRRSFPGEFVSSEADAVTIDALGDITAAGSAVQISQDQLYGAYADSVGVVVKVWGRTGDDYPPSPQQVLSALSDAILALKLPVQIERSLIDKVEAAKTLLDSPKGSHDSQATLMLRVLLKRFGAMKGKTLSVSDADELIHLTELSIQVVAGI
jgi:hypothetical protein